MDRHEEGKGQTKVPTEEPMKKEEDVLCGRSEGGHGGQGERRCQEEGSEK